MLSRCRLDGPSLDLVPISMCPRLGTRLVLPESHGVNLYLAYSVKSGTALAVPAVPYRLYQLLWLCQSLLKIDFVVAKRVGWSGVGGGYKVPCTWWQSWLAVERPWLTLARPFLSSKAQSAIETTPLPF